MRTLIITIGSGKRSDHTGHVVGYIEAAKILDAQSPYPGKDTPSVTPSAGSPVSPGFR